MRLYTVAAIISWPEHLPLIDVRHFSSLGRAVRVVEFVFRAIRLMRRETLLDVAAARDKAVSHLIRTTQQEFFPQEIAAAATHDDLPRSSRLDGIQLFLDDAKLLRHKTRLRESPLFSHDGKNSIVIPGQSHLAALIIADRRRVHAHLGVGTVLAALRRRYWINRARQRIRSILSRCDTCKKQHGRTLQVVEAPLPPSRFSPVVSFRTAGLDYCRQFLTRGGTSTEKCCIALFACFTVRAIHLELVPSMSTPQTHLAIRRFLAPYPSCNSLVSDNARSLVKAATDIKRLFNSVEDPQVKSRHADRGLQWTFNCPRAPWDGENFERVVGTVKAALKRTLGRSLLHFEELRTLISEIAAIVNCRPLSYSLDIPNEPTPITPAHFLRGGPQNPPLCEIIPFKHLSKEQLQNNHLNRTTHFRALVKRWKEDL